MKRVLALQKMKVTQIPTIAAKSDNSCDHTSCFNNG